MVRVLPKGRCSTTNSGTKVAVLTKGKSSTANSETKIAILPYGRSSTANSGTKVAVLRKAGLPLQTPEPRLQFYQGWIGAVASRCFPHSTLFSIWTHFKRSEKVPSEPTRGWGEWIWLIGPSRHTEIHHRWSISDSSGFWPDERSRNPNHPSPPIYT